MTLLEVVQALDAEVLYGQALMDKELETCCGSDLMSDVLAFTKRNTLLCTGMTNIQVVRSADMTDLGGLVIVRGKRPPASFLEEAEAEKLPVLATKHTMFETCGILYACGLKGCSAKE